MTSYGIAKVEPPTHKTRSQRVRFASLAEAKAYRRDLLERWLDTMALTITKSEQPASYRWQEGILTPLEDDIDSDDGSTPVGIIGGIR